MVSQRGRTIALFAIAATFFVSCRGDGEFPLGEPDQTASLGLSIDESAITARVISGAIDVELPFERAATTDNLSGTAAATLLTLTGEELDRREVDFTLNQGVAEGTVEVTGLQGVADGASAGDLASYVVRYELHAGEATLRGRRSLFVMAQRLATIVLGSDDLYDGQPTQLRLAAREPASGEPLADAEVEVLIETTDAEGETSQQQLWRGATDEVGNVLAEFTPPSQVVGTADLVVRLEHDQGAAESRHAVTVQRAHRILLTTDKPLYQPGQTIHLRALSLRLPDRRPSAGAMVTFEVVDSRGNIVFRQEEEANDFGVAAATFTLARQVNMGRYTLRAIVDEAIQERTVTVDRYALPRFAIDFEADHPFYLPGETLRGQLDADYTFGQPVDGGEVTVRASQFDVDWVPFAELHGTTDAEGEFTFDLELPSYFVGLPLEQGGSFVRLELEVTDTAGQSFTLERAITVSQGAVSAFLVPERSTLAPEIANDIFLLTADPTGAPLPTRCQITVGDGLPFTVETDPRGFASFEVTPPAEGSVTVTVVADDGRGGTVTTSQSFATSGQATDTVMLRTDRSLYELGDTATLSIYSPRAQDRLYLDVVRSGQTVLTDIVEVIDGWNEVPIDLTDQLTGALTLSIYYIADSGDIIRDQRTIYVGGGSDLSVEMSLDHDVYRPAESARLDLQITDQGGEGVQSAVGLQVVDEAVFALTEQRPGLERIFFELEGELSQPSYEVHGFGQSDLFDEGEPATEDDQAQRAAQVLFAAGADRAVYGIDYSSERQLTATVQSTSLSGIQTDLGLITERLNRSLDNLDADDDDEVEQFVDQWVRRSASLWYDPWGQRYSTTYEGSNLRIASAGVDEQLGTDDDLETSTWIDLWRGMDDDGWMFDAANGAEDDFDRNGGDPNPEQPAAEENGDTSGEGGEEPRIRSWFPETLLVEPSIITDESGHASIEVPLADSITTWRASAVASGLRGQLGSSTTGITVFQDFFVDLALPATMTLGDEITVPVVVYNYVDSDQDVTIEVTDEPWFTLLSPATQSITLAPREVASVPLTVRVEQVGWHTLQAVGRAGEVADGLRRRIEVMPSGQRHDLTQSDRIEASDEGTLVSFAFDVPPGSVDGASELLVKLYPGVFAQAIEGLDSILRMPSGCFEQTSSSTYPNVMVLRYLQVTDTSTPEIEMQAREYISQGYQRLLTFEVDGGGFEWFGNPPAHSILTAYGLMEFADMAEVHTVDPAVISRTASWLAGRQNGDGSWTPDPGGIAEGAINNYQNDTYRTTAYILWALAESGDTGQAISRGAGYLRSHMDEAADSYSRAIAAQALISVDRTDATGLELLDQLAAEAVVDDDAASWGSEEGSAGLTYSMGDAHVLETTALVIDAFMRAGRHGELTNQGMNFLLRNKDSFGNWHTTQATVYALRAMIRSLEMSTTEADATVDVYHNGALVETMSITSADSDVMRQVDLKEMIVEGGTNEVELVMTGNGSLMYQTVGTFWTPWSDVPEEPTGPISIDVEYDRTDLAVNDTATVNVRVTNNTAGALMMVMVSLGVPPGFDVMSDDLDGLVTDGVFRRWEATGRQVLLYFDEIEAGAPVELSYHLVARNPMRGEAPPSSAYLYYDPDVRVTAPPIDLSVE